MFVQVTEVHDKVKNSLTYLRGIAEVRSFFTLSLALYCARGNNVVY